MTRRVAVGAILALLFVAAPVARADLTVFSNLGPGDSYNTALGNFIGNGLDGSGSNYAQAATFSPSQTVNFSSLEIALSNSTGTNTDALIVSLNSDSGGVPGSTLFSFTVAAGTLGALGINNPLVSFTTSSGPVITAGTNYWITVSDPNGPADSNVWNWNSTGDSSATGISQDGGSTWFAPSGLTPGAYAVDGVPQAVVPEPSMFGVFAGGLIGLAADQWRRARRRKKRRGPSRPQPPEELEGRVVLSTSISWTNVPFAPLSGIGNGTMIQYPNGDIMMVAEEYFNGTSFVFANGVSNAWGVLQPDSHGNYGNLSLVGGNKVYLTGTPRLYFATNVLPNDNIFLLGGEYSGNSGAQNDTNTGEMFVGPPDYSPPTGWVAPVTTFPQATFGDDPSMLLNNGLILLGTGATGNTFTYLYNPTSSPITTMVNNSSQTIAANSYSSAIPMVYTTSNDETGFAKLPTGQVLFYDIFASIHFGNTGGYAELFNPSTGTWQDIAPGDGTANGFIPELSAPTDVNGRTWFEMGPTLLLPNGNVFVVGGGTSNTALYNPSTNTWSAGPTIPSPYTADDAPGAVLPNGDVIFTADSALATGEYTGPTGFFDYSPSAGTITQLSGSNVPADSGLSGPSFPTRMLVLPTGQLMFADQNSDTLWLGTPSGAPQPQWRPVIQNFSGSGRNYTLTGLRLNGLDAGAAYGDDAEMDENYPIVRLTDSSGNVYYALTSGWSNLGVATGSASETVNVTLPTGMPAGNYSVVVSGAGVSSFPVAFHLATSTGPSVIGSGQGANILGSPTPGTAGVRTPASPAPRPSVGIQPLTALPVASTVSELGVLPSFSSASIGGTGSTDAVDAVLASGDLTWLPGSPFRVKPGIASQVNIGPLA
jgi:hypothetical protein